MKNPIELKNNKGKFTNQTYTFESGIFERLKVVLSIVFTGSFKLKKVEMSGGSFWMEKEDVEQWLKQSSPSQGA